MTSNPDPDLWGGLNRPGISFEEADVVVWGIPFDGGASVRKGAAEGPDALRRITTSICPTTEDFEVMDLKILDRGNLFAPDRDALFERVEEAAESCVRAGKRFTFIGGDHSVTIPILRGIDRALDEPLGIVHLDAHFDLCDELGGDRLSHGCTERRALELKSIASLERIFFCGIRSAETQEAEFLATHPAHVIGARAFSRMGADAAAQVIRKQLAPCSKIYLTIDIDCLDPAYAPGPGTPQFGGVSSRELLDLLRGSFPMPGIGVDLVELAPPLESGSVATYAARKIVTECWGHWWRA